MKVGTNKHSLNANANVRNCLNENIYTPGVFGFEMQGGGFPVARFWKSGLERNRRTGTGSCQVGVRGRWGHATSTFTRASFTRSIVRTTSASVIPVDGLARSSMRK